MRSRRPSTAPGGQRWPARSPATTRCSWHSAIGAHCNASDAAWPPWLNRRWPARGAVPRSASLSRGEVRLALLTPHRGRAKMRAGRTSGARPPYAQSPGGLSFIEHPAERARPTEGRISNESPVGRALLGHKKGEKVLVRVPAGDFTYRIDKIT